MPVVICRRYRRQKPRETQLIKDCLMYLRLNNYFAIRVNSGGLVIKDGNRPRMVRLAEAGTPDIIALSPDGHFVAIECKVGRNRPTEAQKRCLDEIKKRKGMAFVVRNIAELEKLIIQNLKWRNNLHV